MPQVSVGSSEHVWRKKQTIDRELREEASRAKRGGVVVWEAFKFYRGGRLLVVLIYTSV